MIQVLNHSQTTVATNIRDVFQASYAIEAALLKAKDFPPLKRTLSEFTNCNNTFYGYYKNNQLAAVIEIKDNHNSIHIQSLVVHPSFFRLGIANKIMQFVLNTYHTKLFTVETGALNVPAIQLYKKFQFIETKQYVADFGIRKVRLEKEI